VNHVDAGREQRDGRERRVTLEHCLGRGRTIAITLRGHQGIEREVLVLQRVHQLVREDQAKLGAVPAFDTIQRARFRIVVSRDLLPVEIEQQLLEIQGLGQSPNRRYAACMPSRRDWGNSRSRRPRM
jgi:hypothetical protein